MVIDGYRWLYMGIRGYRWLYVVIRDYRYSGFYMAIDNNMWL